MSLPVPADRPIAPFYQYDAMNPPFVPPVPIMPVMQRLLPMVCSAVCNEAAQKSTANSLRMFCFNLLSNCNWNSKEFGEVVYLTCGYISMMMGKGLYRNAEMSIGDATQTVLTLYASALIYQYPELRSIVDPRAADAAYQNAPQFDNLKKEIHAMYNPPPGNGMPGNNFDQNGMGGNAHTSIHRGGHGFFPDHGSPGSGHGHHQSMQTHGHYTGHPSDYRGNPGHGGHHGGHGRPVHHHQTRPTVNHSYSGGSAFQSTSQDGAVDRYGSRPRKPAPQQQQEPTQSARYSTEKIETATETTELHIEKGSEMDRARHQLTYFGAAYNQDLGPRAQRLQETTEQLAAANAKESTQKHIYKDWLMCTSLSDAITSGRAEQAKVQSTGSGFNIFRCFAAVTKPIVSTEDIVSLMATLREANNFKEFSIKIQAAAAALEQTKGTEPSQSDSVISFLNQVDNHLTKLINDFLKINLGLKYDAPQGPQYVCIDSFVEDVPVLADHLLKKYGAAVAKAFAAYETEIFAVMVEDVETETLKEMSSGLQVPDSMYITSIPENYSITFVFMSSKELGYKIGSEPVRVNHHTAPNLFRVIDSLRQHKSQMSMPTLYDVIVTSDNEVYRVYRDYLKNNEYMISMM